VSKRGTQELSSSMADNTAQQCIHSFTLNVFLEYKMQEMQL